MLKKISCKDFKNNNGIRPEIIFHKGLNIVLGTDNGKNSIGKTTFLMILDFVFGGEDYTKDLERNDVWLNVGDHTINFEFEFNNKTYSFSRSFKDSDKVIYHNTATGQDETIELAEYTKRLQFLYGLDKYSITLREAVGPFFRVYGRDTLIPNLPLQAANKEGFQKATDRLIKLFNLFAAVKEQKDIYEKAKNDFDGITKGIKYTGVKNIGSKKEYKACLEEIDLLKKDIDELENQSNAGLLDLDSVECDHLTDIGLKMSSLRKQRTYLRSQLKSLNNTKSTTSSVSKSDFSDLIDFFDNVNVKKLEEVNSFHTQINTILKKEYTQIIKETQNMLDIVGIEIKKLEAEKATIKNAPNVSSAILKRFADFNNRLRTLDEGVKNYDKRLTYKEISDKEKVNLDTLYDNTFDRIETIINGELKKLNTYIYGENYTSPMVTLKNSKKFEMYIPNDTGTGSNFAALIMFDLLMLKETPLPVVAHDSFLIVPMENDVFEKIYTLYCNQEKQIFISLDRRVMYDHIQDENFDNRVVLKLGPNGNQLFGKTWRKQNNGESNGNNL